MPRFGAPFTVNFGANTRGLRRGLRSAAGDLRRFNTDVERIGLSGGRKLRQLVDRHVGQIVGGVGIVAAGAATAVTAATVATLEGADSAQQSFRRTTGATGEAADRQWSSVLRTLGRVPDAMETVVASAGTLRTLVTGTDREIGDLNERWLDFARIAETDAAAGADAFGRSLNAFGLDASSGSDALDILTAVTTDYAIPGDALLELLQTFGPVLEAAGKGFEEAAVFIGQLYRGGVDLSRVAPGINQFLRRTATAGIDAGDALDHAFSTIRDAVDGSTALSRATDFFGAEGAVRLADAIRSGAVDWTGAADEVVAASDRLATQTAETATASDQIAETWNGIRAALIDELLPEFQQVVGEIAEIAPEIADAAGKIARAISTSLDEGVRGTVEQVGIEVSTAGIGDSAFNEADRAAAVETLAADAAEAASDRARAAGISDTEAARIADLAAAAARQQYLADTPVAIERSLLDRIARLETQLRSDDPSLSVGDARSQAIARVDPTALPGFLDRSAATLLGRPVDLDFDVAQFAGSYAEAADATRRLIDERIREAEANQRTRTAVIAYYEAEALAGQTARNAAESSKTITQRLQDQAVAEIHAAAAADRHAAGRQRLNRTLAASSQLIRDQAAALLGYRQATGSSGGGPARDADTLALEASAADLAVARDEALTLVDGNQINAELDEFDQSTISAVQAWFDAVDERANALRDRGQGALVAGLIGDQQADLQTLRDAGRITADQYQHLTDELTQIRDQTGNRSRGGGGGALNANPLEALLPSDEEIADIYAEIQARLDAYPDTIVADLVELADDIPDTQIAALIAGLNHRVNDPALVASGVVASIGMRSSSEQLAAWQAAARAAVNTGTPAANIPLLTSGEQHDTWRTDTQAILDATRLAATVTITSDFSSWQASARDALSQGLPAVNVPIEPVSTPSARPTVPIPDVPTTTTPTATPTPDIAEPVQTPRPRRNPPRTTPRTPPPLVFFADGGIVTEPTLGVVAEAGPEAVIPLTGPRSPLSSPTVINITVEGTVVSADELLDAVERGLARRSRTSGPLDIRTTR